MSASFRINDSRTCFDDSRLSGLQAAGCFLRLLRSLRACAVRHRFGLFFPWPSHDVEGTAREGRSPTNGSSFAGQSVSSWFSELSLSLLLIRISVSDSASSIINEQQEFKRLLHNAEAARAISTYFAHTPDTVEERRANIDCPS